MTASRCMRASWKRTSLAARHANRTPAPLIMFGVTDGKDRLKLVTCSVEKKVTVY